MIDIEAIRAATTRQREVWASKGGPAPISMWCDDVDQLCDEVERLRGVIAQHDLCHDQHGKVDAEAFATACNAEQRRIYGRAPTADEVERLRAALVAAMCALRSYQCGNSAPDLAKEIADACYTALNKGGA